GRPVAWTVTRLSLSLAGARGEPTAQDGVKRVAGVVTNSLLLYCIRFHTRTFLGAYKELLSIFATVDIMLTLIHAIVNPREGHEYEDPWYILTIVLFDSIMVLSLTTALTYGTLTFVGIRRGITVSTNKKSIELKLLVAVTAQTLVPFGFVYIPYFSVLNLPPFGLPVEQMADLTMFLTSYFPVWDAVVILTLMADYRRAVWTMVWRRKGSSEVGPSTRMSTMMTTMAPTSIVPSHTQVATI
ncbi:hypothetical protein PRIPAC_77892, partial [Pristionchus pacificus]|uniref:G protein-coupled receptor n=1 Tax=Pristionchus pacificus TaxID=54126 RepID=A0A2A6CKE5_PRIPA